MQYNGWANWETWNVALWIGNDEGLYRLAVEAGTYAGFKARLRELSEIREPVGQPYGHRLTQPAGLRPIGYQTPDGVAWDDSGIDVEAIDDMIGELS